MGICLGRLGLGKASAHVGSLLLEMLQIDNGTFVLYSSQNVTQERFPS